MYTSLLGIYSCIYLRLYRHFYATCVLATLCALLTFSFPSHLYSSLRAATVAIPCLLFSGGAHRASYAYPRCCAMPSTTSSLFAASPSLVCERYWTHHAVGALHGMIHALFYTEYQEPALWRCTSRRYTRMPPLSLLCVLLFIPWNVLSSPPSPVLRIWIGLFLTMHVFCIQQCIDQRSISIELQVEMIRTRTQGRCPEVTALYFMYLKESSICLPPRSIAVV